MENTKFKFIIDKKYISVEYTLAEILTISEEVIFENMEECNCAFTESCNHCECEPQFEESEITGKIQFIGITDKNGREIYEGDIVKNSYIDKGVVYFDTFRVSYMVNENGSKFTLVTSQHSFEVIGNIHENPEILK